MKANKEKNFISAIVYIHNNEEDVENFCKLLYKELESNFDKSEVIFVNDNCSDNSMNIISDFAKLNKKIVTTFINMSVYQGIELAMNAGVDLAIGDFVFEFDSIILDYSPAMIMDVYNRSLSGFDIVSAFPDTKQSLTSTVFYSVFNRFSGSKYKIRTERFRILSRRAINRVKSLSKTISYRKAAYINCGLSYDSLLYKCTLKKMNTVSGSRNTRKKTAFDSIILFTDVAYRISMSFTIILLLCTIITGIYTIAIYLGKDSPIEGWTTTMLILSGSFSGMFLIFAIIIKYLSIIVELVLKKQRYLIESVGKI